MARDTARTFQNTSQASFYVTTYRLSGVEVLFAFEPDHSYDFVPLRFDDFGGLTGDPADGKKPPPDA